MATTFQLLATAILLSLAFSGCTVRVDGDEAADPGMVPSDSTSSSTSYSSASSPSSSSWSMTTNACTVTDQTPQDPQPQDIKIKESEEVVGPLSKSWDWNVGNSSYQDFHVRLHLSGPKELPQYHTNQLRIKLEGGCGQRPHQSGSWSGSNLQVSTSTQPAGNVIDYKGAGPTTIGQWTLTIEAQEALVVYDVEVIVDYPAKA